jgi:uncharacterized protein YbaP (TraB family)
MKHLALFLATLLVLTINAALPAIAQVPRCVGTSMLEEEKRKDPKAFARAMALAKSIPNAQAIFWRIEKPGRDKVSWLLGTIHITDPRVHKLPVAAQKAIYNANAVALELSEVGDKSAAITGFLNNLSLVALEPGANLWDMLGQKNAKVVIDELARRGMPSGIFAGMQPYVVSMMIGMPQCELKRTNAGKKALDAALANIARARKIPLIGLETVREQLSAMASMSMKDQQAFLLETAKYGPRSVDTLETMIELYLNRKMNLAFGMMKLQSSNGVVEHFTRILLTKRNKVMFRRSLPLIEKGGTFIAVGALHLLGKNGLVSLFENAGYKMVPVN